MLLAAIPRAGRWSIFLAQMSGVSATAEDDFAEKVYFQLIPHITVERNLTALAKRMMYDLNVESIFDRADRQLDLILISIMYKSADFIAAQHHRFEALIPSR